MRGVEAIEALAQNHDDQDIIVVVSHADIIKLVLAYYLGVHIDLFQRIIVSPASVSVLHLSGNGVVRIGRVNDDGPLQPRPKPVEKQKKPKEKKEKSDNGDTAVADGNTNS
jgi:broad specificity phosphatase PhoE